jgi:2-polyprenyl-6-methoxyphenol hydroxylase-like FAD-dependent oxidoreductase
MRLVNRWCTGAGITASRCHCRAHGSRTAGRYDAIIVGGGHNGLVAAAYLSKAGKRVLVLERRHVLGGAAVTEEIIPGYRFSRASYVYSLFRPHIVRDLGVSGYASQLSNGVPSHTNVLAIRDSTRLLSFTRAGLSYSRACRPRFRQPLLLEARISS